MPTDLPRPQDSSILGESWVVASSHPGKDERQSKGQPFSNQSRSARLDSEDSDNGRNNGSESMTTSASSISGPELIMPSIYEAPVSEGSWVAPAVRFKSESLRRRHKASRASAAQNERKGSDTPGDRVPPRLGQDSRQKEEKLAQARSPSSSRPTERLIRTIINTLLVVAISHLLIIPEVVQQFQTLCTIETISTLYPASCIPPFPKPQPTRHRASRYDTVVSSQAQLESLLNTTLHEMTPLANTLKQSESKLRDVENELKKVYPGTKHELDLEFNGCWEATRAANKKFNSLKADIRSAVDNLVVTGGARAGDSQTVAQDARLSTQVSWREQYLDQLTARMQGKADALSNDLATLDDHLESIDSILAREMRLSSAGTPNSAMNSASSGVRAIVNKLPSFLRPPEEADDLSRSDLSVSKLFQDAANQHRPVVNAVRHLSYGLQTLQKKKAY